MPPCGEGVDQLEAPGERTPGCGECHLKSWSGLSLRSAITAGGGESWSLFSHLKRAVLGREGWFALWLHKGQS